MEDVREVADNGLRVLLATTPKGKELYLMRVPNKSVRCIAFGSGGVLPACLEGGYSSVSAAKSAALSYVAGMEGKEVAAEAGYLPKGEKSKK